jgi:hypothetical protein
LGHEPQGLGGMGAVPADELVVVAKTDSCFSR